MQILATEHWGLLAARNTAQNEVLTRITICLALVSAGLVTIGLLGQASRFAGSFGGASLAFLAFLTVIGFMTQVRVMNACVAGLLPGSATIAGGGAFEWAVGIAVGVGLLCSAGFVVFGGYVYRSTWKHYVPRRPTPSSSSSSSPPER